MWVIIHEYSIHPSLEISPIGVHQNIYIWTSVSCQHVWVYWRNEALMKRERKGEEEEAAASRAKERRRRRRRRSSEIGCKKWSLWSRSGCNCAAAFLAEEFGRERSIWEEFNRQLLCIFARWLTVCLKVSRVRGGNGGCLWRSLSLSQPITVSIVHSEHTVSGGTSEEKSWFFFETQKKKKRRRKGSLQYVKSQMYVWSMDLDVVVVGLMILK